MGEELRIGIVGSRRRNTESDRRFVYDIVRTNITEPGKLVVVSGACPEGADDFARQAVEFFQKEIGQEYVRLVEFPIRKWKGMTKWEFTQQAYFRNRLIPENSHRVYALVHHDRTGGTENTVSHCYDLEVPCYLVGYDGQTYLRSLDPENRCDVRRDADKA